MRCYIATRGIDLVHTLLLLERLGPANVKAIAQHILGRERMLHVLFSSQSISSADKF